MCPKCPLFTMGRSECGGKAGLGRVADLRRRGLFHERAGTVTAQAWIGLEARALGLALRLSGGDCGNIGARLQPDRVEDPPARSD